MALPKKGKQWGNAELSETKPIIHQLKGIDESYPKFEPLRQKLWAFLSDFGIFTMPTHQIWSYHVTQEANFENFLLCPNSAFNIRKTRKLSSGKLSNSEVISQKPHGGWKHPPPSAFRVKTLS